jgi:hypothetical protein
MSQQDYKFRFFKWNILYFANIFYAALFAGNRFGQAGRWSDTTADYTQTDKHILVAYQN